MANNALIVFCTFPTLEEARRVIRELVELNLIACGNILPGVESIYRWKGVVETSAEALAILKTTEEALDQLQVEFKSRHSYEVPELVAVPIAAGLPAYLNWIHENVHVKVQGTKRADQ
jgi:periplasmic divalent cation tolerance protein